jgi:1-pyrroline-5-carboxylate dehydrogenase
MSGNIEKPKNDVDNIPTYEPGSSQRVKLTDEIRNIKGRTPIEIPLIINGKEVRTNDVVEVRCPHNKELVLARAHIAGEDEIQQAIESSLDTQPGWSQLDQLDRLMIFNRAADLLSGLKRTEIVATIMLNLSKNPFEAEIDLAELVDFWKFNAFYAKSIFKKQPYQHPGETNRMDWRPLEGFILAITPFNFYSIGGNLPTAPAMVGNVALWKPARSAIFSNFTIMKILMEVELPAGVINFIPFSSEDAETVLSHPGLAGLHFTGSYDTLVTIWKNMGRFLENYINFPKVVGETGGKGFIFMHESADVRGYATNIVRGAFGYQGQKCSAASRAYVPESKWDEVNQILQEELPMIKYGATENLENYMGAVIDRQAYEKIISYIQHATSRPDEYELVYGGRYDSSQGWFVEPTIFLSKDPKSVLMTEEIFGPVLTVYLYPEGEYEETLKLCDETSPYGLTGAIFANDRFAIQVAEKTLRYAAGNFYINDKPSGAVVGRQPFGGARNSGTNDKAGSWINILRWLSPRTIKETTILPTDWRRDFLN